MQRNWYYVEDEEEEEEDYDDRIIDLVDSPAKYNHNHNNHHHHHHNNHNNNHNNNNNNNNNNLNYRNNNNNNYTTTTTTTTTTSTSPKNNNNYNNNNATYNNNATVNKNTTNNKINNNNIQSINLTDTDTNIDTTERDIQLILQIFPDCDLEYLRNIVLSSTSFTRVQDITNTFLETKNYKKVEKEKEKKEQYNNDSNNLEELKNKDYYNTTSAVSAIYQDTCAKVLANKFPTYAMTYIRGVMKTYNNHYLPSLRAIEKDHKLKGNTKKTLKGQREQIALPNSRDEEFWKEFEYSLHENVLKQEQEDLKLAQQLNEEEYSKTGQLIECGCCYGEYAFEDMAQCPDGHLFCGDCTRKGAEEVLGSGKTVLKCYTAGCDFEFVPSVMAKFLPKKTLEYFQKRQQEEELNKVDIPGLEKCPFCPYAVIVENTDDKVFHCPNCKKDTCRLCKEESHIPLRCNEVEKKQSRDMRLFVEQQMTEALCRKCNNPRCGKLFFKEEGCNHMKCTCGWEMCYVCRATIKGYGHFKEGGCVLHEDTKKRNRDEVKNAEKAAKNDYVIDHPELADQLIAAERARERNERERERARHGNRKPKKRRSGEPITIL